MRKELEKLTKEQLIQMIEHFEYYPAVTMDDDEDYILSYLEDESCRISKKEIAEYLLKNGVEINQENINLYYECMNDEDLIKNREIISPIFNNRFKMLKNELFTVESEIDWIYYTRTNCNGYIISQTFFDVKDILKPINEYISDIKNHDAYKSYISKVS